MASLPVTEPYGEFWDAMARADARTAIFSQPDGSTTGEDAFDQSGRNDAARLRRFVGPDSVVLDVGCGIGRIEKHLAPHCRRLVAVDVSPEMLSRAADRCAERRNVELVRAAAMDLSAIDDDTFDFAFCLLLLQHLEHEDAFLALREMARVLKPTGRALIQFPNLLSPIYGAAFAGDALADRRPVARVRVYTPELAERIVSLAGLEVVEQDRRDPNEIELVVRRQALIPEWLRAPRP